MFDAFFNKQKAEIHQDDKKRIGYGHVGSLTLKPGMYLWKFNLETRECTKVEMDVTVSFHNGKNVRRGKVTIQDKTLYCTAINKKNALRKFKKIQWNMMIESQQKR